MYGNWAARVYRPNYIPNIRRPFVRGKRAGDLRLRRSYFRSLSFLVMAT